MVQKGMKAGISTGNSLKLNARNSYDYPSEGVLQITSSDCTDSEISIDGTKMSVDVFYSLGKKKRWCLGDYVRACHEEISDIAKKCVVITENITLTNAGKRKMGRCTSYFDSAHPTLSQSPSPHRLSGLPRLLSAKAFQVASHPWDKRIRYNEDYFNRLDNLNTNSEEEDEYSPPKDHSEVNIDVFNSVPKSCALRMRGGIYYNYDSDDFFCKMGRKNQEHKTSGSRSKKNFRSTRRRSLYTEIRKEMKDVPFLLEDYSSVYHVVSLEKETERPTAMEIDIVDLVQRQRRTQSRAQKKKRHRKRAPTNDDDLPSFKTRKIFVDEEFGTELISNKTEVDDEEIGAVHVLDMTCPILPFFDLRITAKDLEPDRLSDDWGKNYREGTSSPRCFHLDLSSQVGISSPALIIIFQIEKRDLIDQEYCNARLLINVLNDDLPEIVWSWFSSSQTEDLSDVVSRLVDGLKRSDIHLASISPSQHKAVRCQTSVENPFSGFTPITKDLVVDDLFKNHREWNSQAQTTITNQQDNLVEDGFVTLCGICLDDVTDVAGGVMTALNSCNHAFCLACWKQHLLVSIKTGRRRLHCPQVGCKMPVDCVTALSVLPLSVYQARLPVLEQEVFHGLDESITGCINPECKRIILVDFAQQKSAQGNPTVHCQCETAFCLRCHSEAHWPASCTLNALYLRQMRRLGDNLLGPSRRPDHGRTVLGKRCPRCQQFIEKKGGCPHMTCSCGMEFCWDCGDNYRDEVHMKRGCQRSQGDFGELLFNGYEPPPPGGLRSRTYCTALRVRLMQHPTRMADMMRGVLRLERAAFHFSAAGEAGTPLMAPPSLVVRTSNLSIDPSDSPKAAFIFSQYRQLLNIIEFLWVESNDKSRRIHSHQLLLNLAHSLLYLVARIENTLQLNVTINTNSEVQGDDGDSDNEADTGRKRSPRLPLASRRQCQIRLDKLTQLASSAQKRLSVFARLIGGDLVASSTIS